MTDNSRSVNNNPAVNYLTNNLQDITNALMDCDEIEHVDDIRNALIDGAWVVRTFADDEGNVMFHVEPTDKDTEP